MFAPNPAETPFKLLYPACNQPKFGASKENIPEKTVLSVFFSTLTKPENLLSSKKPLLLINPVYIICPSILFSEFGLIFCEFLKLYKTAFL